MLDQATRSHQTLRTVNGIEFKSFQEAAYARGLIEHHNEAEICFNEAAQFSTSNQRHNLFYQFTREGCAIIHIFQNQQLLRRMIDMDILPENGYNWNKSVNDLLVELRKRFKQR